MLCEKLKEFADTLSFKRPEENYKYIFKKCLKKLKAKVGEKLEIKCCKKEEFERRFYEFYFKEIAARENLKIECFYQPRNAKCADDKDRKTTERRNIVKTVQLSKKDIPKTISCKYIQNISKSKQFLDDFFTYLNEYLLNEHVANIDKKIHAMSNDWQLLLNDGLVTELTIGEICKKIEKNTKFKLPWTVKEVQTAIAAVEKLFKNNGCE